MAAPVVSSEELASFHATHFSSSAADYFAQHFLGPVDDEHYVENGEEEDDGIGYYEDGVKRTLTDQQIAIFRHSEIQALLRERRHAAEAKDDEIHIEAAAPMIGPVQPEKSNSDLAVKPILGDREMEDGEVGDNTTSDAPTPTSQSSNKNRRPFSKSKAKKADRGKQRGYYKEVVKPDLRKRTWDVVEQGLGSLDYDEGSSNMAPSHPAQRRRITYED
ncbi:uncharacterized protein LY89DRAFT_663076 [Mollisia scopiformis]|uniref:Uncharacterized protein n=1 Tax=Mollisia scopiformis TaxID=149040 RepID=A0A194XW14_MOLSC|nr:uncharacterized protein LY89DRAFT_663076 [Mollisia scopiformis]KUJ24326.1 hypothetical protein LY89DRAFT_663076 [Mollisia scopiformis]